MQFIDGNRIDLTVFDINQMSLYENDSQTILLLDKDNLFPNIPESSDSDYLPKPPTEKKYFDCCNEFWWVSTYVAKGLWRNEITYAKEMFDKVIRTELMKMLTWYFAIQTDSKIAPGKSGKNISKYIDNNIWNRYLGTYSDSNLTNNWNALFTATVLFRELAKEVAGKYNFQYLHDEDRKVSEYLNRIHANKL